MSTIPTPKGDFHAALGERFKAVRRGRKVWLRDLAKELGVSVNTIRWHESGARMLRVDLLVKAADHMGVEPGELLGEAQFDGNSNGEVSNGVQATG